MKRLRFYHISDKYIKFLHSIDNRVLYNKGEARPYVGIVLTINALDYYVPLESPRPDHKNIKSGGPVLKIDNGNLGIMGFNNMIPVKDVCLVNFDINSLEDQSYKLLLQNQLRFCNKNKKLIGDRANSVYKKTVIDKVPFYKSSCCDFKRLEKACKKYNPNYKPASKRYFKVKDTK